jgi:hypothetical protein
MQKDYPDQAKRESTDDLCPPLKPQDEFGPTSRETSAYPGWFGSLKYEAQRQMLPRLPLNAECLEFAKIASCLSKVYWGMRLKKPFSYSGGRGGKTVVSIFNVVLISLSFNLVFAAYVVWRHFVGSSRAGGSATLTIVDHHVETIGGNHWKSDAIEIWRDHGGELQQLLLVQKHSGRADRDDKPALRHLPEYAIPV